MEQSRINLGEAAPQLYAALGELDGLVVEFGKSVAIDEGFAHLLRLRASQLNQCAFCVRLHTADALASGESTDRIAVLPAWRESGYFSEQERAALALIESVTLIADGQVPEPVYSEAASVLSEDKIAAIEWIGVVINAWNRIAISSRYPVRP
jgi:AhpD family alkylhydroperoxidase